MTTLNNEYFETVIKIALQNDDHVYMSEQFVTHLHQWNKWFNRVLPGSSWIYCIIRQYKSYKCFSIMIRIMPQLAKTYIDWLILKPRHYLHWNSSDRDFIIPYKLAGVPLSFTTCYTLSRDCIIYPDSSTECKKCTKARPIIYQVIVEIIYSNINKQRDVCTIIAMYVIGSCHESELPT